MHMNIKEPYKKLDKGSDPETGGADFCEQDGLLFAWSDSNVGYELAWWHYTRETGGLIDKLKEERPLPKGCTIVNFQLVVNDAELDI